MSIQLFQFFSGISWFGLVGRYSARNPGIFLLPNTGAFFSIVFLFYVLFLKEKQKIKYKFLLTLLAVISILLTGSGTGLVAVSVIIGIYILPRRFIVFSPFVLILSFLLLKFLSTYIRGEEYIEISGGTRLAIFFNTFQETGIFSPSFGYFTNVANLMAAGDKIMDSTYASILGNLGIFPFVVLIIMVLFYLLKAFWCLNKTNITFLLIVLLFSATTIILEVYPMNMLLAIMGSVLYEKGKNEHCIHYI